MRVALYLRVSTTEQTTASQRADLERFCAQRSYTIVAVYEDHGISGAKRRRDRPQFDAMLKDAVRGRFELCAAWAVDRLGRSMPDLVRTLEELKAAKINLYLHQQGLDTTTPFGEAMFQMAGVFAQLERSMTIARVRSGIASARAKGVRLGRPSLPYKVRQDALNALLAGSSVRAACKASGAGVGTVAMMRQQLVASGELAAA